MAFSDFMTTEAAVTEKGTPEWTIHFDRFQLVVLALGFIGESR